NQSTDTNNTDTNQSTDTNNTDTNQSNNSGQDSGNNPSNSSGQNSDSNQINPSAPPTVVLSNSESVTQAANIGGQTVQDLTIAQGGSVSNGTLAGSINSEGLISNIIIDTGATLNGGLISGSNINNGTIRDATITAYSEITGGLFEGDIINRGMLSNIHLGIGSTLTGGTLSDIIQNKGTIFDVSLNAQTRLIGGVMGGIIKGSAAKPAYLGAVEILSGATLSHVRISPTTQLPDDVVIGEGVIFPTSYNQPSFADFGIDETQLSNMDIKAFQGIEPAVLGLFEPKHLQQLPLAIFAEFEAADMSYLQPATVSALSVEQLEQLPLDALAGLTANNVDALNRDVLETMNAEQLTAITPEAIQQAVQPAKIFTQLNPEKISPAQLKAYLPKDWTIDEETGKITTPTGTKLTYKALQNTVVQQAGLPEIADLSTSFSLGGTGDSSAQQDLNTGLQQSVSLDSVDLNQFIFTQNEQGILNIIGEGDYAGIKFAFLPGVNNIEQAPLDAPVGLAQDEGGFFIMITPEQQEFFLTPSSNDPVGLVNVLGGESITTNDTEQTNQACEYNDSVAKFNQSGDVLLKISQDDNTRNRNTRGFETEVHVVGMFDAFVEPAPDDFCIDGECDWAQMPDNLQMGMHFSDNLRALQQSYVTYPDGSSQVVYPTVLYPEKFEKLIAALDGIEKVIYQADGSFKVIYFGQTATLYPNFETQVTALPNPNALVKPSIEFQEGG
ncbi:MAG: hypothetical protein VSS52_006990, partial [Thiotrichaceae bacterium]|nr:hypothetical protein [Thiotrichaceae bacterium]